MVNLNPRESARSGSLMLIIVVSSLSKGLQSIFLVTLLKKDWLESMQAFELEKNTVRGRN